MLLISLLRIFMYASLCCSADSSCEGPPFLYMSQNGVSEISKYSRDGCLLSNGVLINNPKPALLRSMALGNYEQTPNVLYVADAGATDRTDSKVLVYNACNADGNRQFETTAVDQRKLSGAAHAYGIAFDQRGDLYVSFQRSESVIRFSADTFQPAPLPPPLRTVSPAPAAGTFFQFTYRHSGEGVRAIAFVGENLWIADERTDAISVVDSDGHRIRKIQIRHPIGVFYSQDHNLVFCGSRSSYGLIYALDPDTYDIIHRYHAPGMTHPTGLTVYNDILFALLHHTGRVVTFDIPSAKVLKTIASGFEENSLEQIVLSDC